MQSSTPCSPHFLRCTECTLPPLLHVPFQFLGYYPVFFFFGGARVSLSRGLCWYIPGVAVGILCAAYLLICWSESPKQVWSLCLQCGSLLSSQCRMAWRSFVWAGGSGCQSFASSWCFFSARCGSSISARFLIYRAHAVCFLPLSPSWIL
jgi:hypothetical protein